MKKPNSICNICHKPKKLDCDRCKPKKYEGIKTNNYSLYNSRKWRKFSHQLRKDNPLCKHCMEQGRTTPSQMVDHIREINKGGSIWDLINLQCLCNSCHAKKTGKSKRV